MTDTIKALIEAYDGTLHYYDLGKQAWKAMPAIAAMYDANKELREVLLELCDLMDGVINGDYKPDSFTLQPARAALAKYGRE